MGRGISFPDTSLLNRLCILLDTDIESILYGQEQSNQWLGILILDNNISPEMVVYNKTTYPLFDFAIFTCWYTRNSNCRKVYSNTIERCKNYNCT